MESPTIKAKPWYKKWWMLLIIAAIIGITVNYSNKRKRKGNGINYQQVTPEKKIHRCGRTWNGRVDRVVGVYGDYCCEECYLENYQKD